MATGRDGAVEAHRGGPQAASGDELQHGQGLRPLAALLTGAEAGVQADDVGVLLELTAAGFGLERLGHRVTSREITRFARLSGLLKRLKAMGLKDISPHGKSPSACEVLEAIVPPSRMHLGPHSS